MNEVMYVYDRRKRREIDVEGLRGSGPELLVAGKNGHSFMQETHGLGLGSTHTSI